MDILIVDDNEIHRTVLRVILTQLGYAISDASDGSSAIERIRASPIDLLFTDIDMPDMSGIELAQSIRALEKERKSAGKIQIVAITANTALDIQARCKEAGMNGLMQKPVTPERIRAELLKIWRRLRR